MKFSTEYNLVSDLIAYPDELVKVMELVPALAIKDLELRKIYEAIVEIWASGEKVDSVVIYQKTKCDVIFLSKLTEKIPSKVYIERNAKEISKEYQRQRLDRKLNNAIAKNKENDPVETLAYLGEISSTETFIEARDQSSKGLIERYTETQRKNAEHGMGIDTGFMCYSDKFLFYCPNHVWIIGGFTSTGKTAKMIEMLYKGHLSGMVSTVISTEMSEDQNINRLLARMTGLSQNYLISGRIKEEHREQIAAAKAKIESWDMKIYDSIYELPSIEMCVRRSFLQRKVDVVFIDYAQNIIVPDAKSEYQENSRIAKSVQRMAKLNKCTVILLSQLSNDAAKDDNGYLQYKGSGAYAAVADVGLILRRSKEENNMLLADVRKNRHGQLLTQVFQFEDNWTRLKEIYHKDNK